MSSSPTPPHDRDPASPVDAALAAALARAGQGLAAVPEQAARSHLEAITALATEHAHAPPAPPRPAGWRQRVRRVAGLTAVKVAIGAGVAVAGTTGGLAATGNLPAPVQQVVSDGARWFGVQVPAPGPAPATPDDRDPRPGDGADPADGPAVDPGTGTPVDPGSPDDAGVSEDRPTPERPDPGDDPPAPGGAGQAPPAGDADAGRSDRPGQGRSEAPVDPPGPGDAGDDADSGANRGADDAEPPPAADDPDRPAPGTGDGDGDAPASPDGPGAGAAGVTGDAVPTPTPGGPAPSPGAG